MRRRRVAGNHQLERAPAPRFGKNHPRDLPDRPRGSATEPWPVARALDRLAGCRVARPELPPAARTSPAESIVWHHGFVAGCPASRFPRQRFGRLSQLAPPAGHFRLGREHIGRLAGQRFQSCRQNAGQTPQRRFEVERRPRLPNHCDRVNSGARRHDAAMFGKHSTITRPRRACACRANRTNCNVSPNPCSQRSSSVRPASGSPSQRGLSGGPVGGATNFSRYSVVRPGLDVTSHGQQSPSQIEMHQHAPVPAPKPAGNWRSPVRAGACP